MRPTIRTDSAGDSRRYTGGGNGRRTRQWPRGSAALPTEPWRRGPTLAINFDRGLGIGNPQTNEPPLPLQQFDAVTRPAPNEVCKK